MLKSTLLSAVAMALIFSSNAQMVFDDFEGSGTINTWYADDCSFDNYYPNPNTTGSNTSATVLRYNDTGGTWANVRFDVSDNFLFTSGHTFSVDLFVPSNSLTGNQTNQISLKLQDKSIGQPWSTQSEIIKPIVLDQWQTLTFDWVNDPYQNIDPSSPAPSTRTDFNRVLFQINGENNGDFVIAYLDNVEFDGVLDTAGNQPPPVFDQLVWSDEFNGSGMIDTSKWFHQTLLPDGNSWFNGELQHYTDELTNSFVDSGYLHIVAKNESYTDQGVTKQYTSARLNSKYAFTYGRVEVRAKLPTGAGTWPAIWTLGKNIDEPGGYWTDQHGTTPWPACGEMDIMEHWGINQDYISSATHTPSSFGGTVNVGGITLPGVSNEFNVYALDWYPERLDFSVNGNIFYSYEPNVLDAATWPFILDQYILLNIAIDGNITSSFSESDMIIDYVRVYQSQPSGLDDTEGSIPWNLYPNPASQNVNVSLPEGLSGREALICSATGKIVQKIAIEAPITSFSVEHLESGIYYLCDPENKLSPIRFLKVY